MSPDLKPGDLPDDLHGRKFIRIGKRIYYADEPEEEVKHFDLATKIGIRPDEMDQVVVDDGGMLFGDEKIGFGGFTRSCKIKGDSREARAETEKIAKEILGDDKVY